ncbi:MAG: 50S ribosomal protein L9 [Flavobacteriales bacterium]|nr:50S ribosomal protein L9 [Flavobacteriales bacterium]|tara:strand:- start:4109 stop:4564 length:456 start_codon:yes stop_codon:yes gene_type:complete
MEVILKKDIENLGFLDDVVKVKAGYGRNYLIPNGLAVLATTSEKKILQENLKQKEQKNQKIIEELDSVKTKIESLELKIKSKVGEDQKLFGSVTTASIAAELKKEDIDVEKKYIMINGVNIIKTIGSFSATIRLHRGLTANLSFEVVAEKA